MRRTASFLVLFIAACCATASAADAPRPNILLCISDDQSWCHTGHAGDASVRTPNFDRLCDEGVYFSHAFCAAPSCSPSRAALLAGKQIWQLGVAAAIFGPVHPDIALYPELLAAAGYHVGSTGKGWGPGEWKPWGRPDNPCGPAWQQAGKDYAANFAQFLDDNNDDAPFCFWFGSTDPHQPFTAGSGASAGIDAAAVTVPPQHPDTPEVRSDITDYLFEVERFDQDVGKLLEVLAQRGLAENTLVVVTSDHGWDFSRGKATLYDYGARVPLVARWPKVAAAGVESDAMVTLIDLAPTFLEAAGVPVPADMSGRSLLPLLRRGGAGDAVEGFAAAVYGIERHGPYRAGGLGYPSRALRTRDFLYIRNFHPERWPNGDPPYFADPSSDRSQAKQWILAHREAPEDRRLFELAYGKRPAEELYDVRRDPYQLQNVAGQPEYAEQLATLRGELERQLKATSDPRLSDDPDSLDRIPLFQKRLKGDYDIFWPADNDQRLEAVRANW